MTARRRRIRASLLLLAVAALVGEGTPALGESVTYPTVVTLVAYNEHPDNADPAKDDWFGGTLFADYDNCRIYREVSVYRARLVRRNGRQVRSDVLIGTTLASNTIGTSTSTWAIPREDARDGRYYAKAPQRVLFRGENLGTAHDHVCAADVSPMVTVNDDPAQ